MQCWQHELDHAGYDSVSTQVPLAINTAPGEPAVGFAQVWAQGIQVESKKGPEDDVSRVARAQLCLELQQQLRPLSHVDGTDPMLSHHHHNF